MEKETENQEEQEKKQIVYMVPSQDMEDDEIDLWQLILPLVKYKVQILLFLVVGLAIGVGISWRDHRNSTVLEDIPSPAVSKTELYKGRLNELLGKAETIKKDLETAIDNIEGNKRIIEIVSAEYQYPLNGESKGSGIVSLNNFEWFNPRLMNVSPTDYRVVFTTAKTDTSILKTNLKAAYHDLEKRAETLYLMGSKKKELIVERALIDGSAGSYSNLHDLLKNSPLGNDPEFIKLKNQIKISEVRFSETMTRINRALFSLSEQVYFDNTFNKVPSDIWADISRQVHQGKKDKDRTEFRQVSVIQSKIQQLLRSMDEIAMTRETLNFLEKGISVPKQLAHVLATNTGEIRRTSVQVSSYTPLNKVALISLIIAFFLGIFSVYLRVLIINAGKQKGFEKQKKELIEALKFWKL